MCAEGKIDQPEDVLASESLEVNGHLVLLAECEDGEHLAIVVVLQPPLRGVDELSLLRQLMHHNFDHLADTVAMTFTLVPETRDIAARLVLPMGGIEDPADFREILELAVQQAQETYAEVCAKIRRAQGPQDEPRASRAAASTASAIA
jgi:hypothetical protein